VVVLLEDRASGRKTKLRPPHWARLPALEASLVSFIKELLLIHERTEALSLAQLRIARGGVLFHLAHYLVLQLHLDFGLGLHLRARLQLDRLELAHVRLSQLYLDVSPGFLLQELVKLLFRDLQTAQIEV